MFNLLDKLAERRFTETTALPMNTYAAKTEERATLQAWVTDVDALRAAVYSYTVCGTATVNDVFTAWKKLFAYFPEKLIGATLKAEADDVKIFMAACGKYVKADDGGKEWRDAPKATFRKIVEDTIVDRDAKLKNKSIEDLDRERKERADRRKKAKAEQIAKLAAMLGVNEETAKAILKSKEKKNTLDSAKAAFTKDDKKNAALYDAANATGETETDAA